MENKTQREQGKNWAEKASLPSGKLEEKFNLLMAEAKKEWGCLADGGKVNDCVIEGNSYTRVYYGPKNKELFLYPSALRVNRGEYVITNDRGYPETIRVYSPELEYQFTYKMSLEGCGGKYSSTVVPD